MSKPNLEKIQTFEKKASLRNLRTLMLWRKEGDEEIKKACLHACISILRHNLTLNAARLKKDVRDGLIKLLIQLDPDLMLKLSKELASSDVMVQLRAIQILGLMGKNEQIKPILSKAIQSRDSKVRATVISVFRIVVNVRDLDFLLSFLGDPDPRVRANLVEVIEELGEKNLTGILIRYKRDPNNRVRGNVLKALWTLGYKDIMESIKEMAMSENELMRASVIWVIGEIGKDNPDFYPFLNQLANDPSALVKENVQKSLLKLGGESLIQTYPFLFSNIDPNSFPS